MSKSSLLNHLCYEKKNHRYRYCWTTRDVIEEYVNVRGVPLKLIDTAGIRETETLWRQVGVERSRKALADSDLILLVLNQSEELTEEDRQLLEATKGLKRVILLNKMDLPTKLDPNELQELVAEEILSVSVLSNTGLDQLEAKMLIFSLAAKQAKKMLPIFLIHVILLCWIKHAFVTRSD